MYARVVLLLIIIEICDQCRSSNILGVIPFPSYSHQVVFRPIWKKLSLKGHNVTVLTTDPMNDPELTNLTEIDLHSSYEIWRSSGIVTFASENQLNFFKMADKIVKVMEDISTDQLEHPEVQKLIKDTNTHFDLVIVEPMVFYGMAFSEHFKCPFIAVLPIEAPNLYHNLVGNPTHPVIYPDIMLPFLVPLTFKERVISVLFAAVNKMLMRVMISPQTDLMRRYFGEHLPPVEDIMKKVGLLFVNANPAFSSVRPLTPATILIGGGTHLEQPKPLPQDIKQYLDNSTNGVIYFSLGSNVKSADISIDMRNVILEGLGELPYRVLWKFEEDNLPGKPENIRIAKWFPQQDILRHPNIKAFITQGGLQSTEEAIYANVPLIGMPFLADQMANVKKIVSHGFGISVDRYSFNKESFKQSILEVVNNPIYRKRINEVRELSTDRPMSGIEEAVWWTEYMLRHNDTKHLKGPCVTVPLYQFLLLDVISFLLFVPLITVYLVFKLIRHSAMLLCRKTHNKQKKN